MDIEKKVDVFFLLPGVSPGKVVPRGYRNFVDWLTVKTIGQPWTTVYAGVQALGQVTNSALASAPADASMERGAEVTFRCSVALLLHEIDAPAEITDPVQCACYAGSADADHGAAAHVYITQAGGPEKFEALFEAELRSQYALRDSWRG